MAHENDKKEPIPEMERPTPDYYHCLLRNIAEHYNAAAKQAKQTGNSNREMYFAGRYDGIMDALRHYEELNG